MEKTKKIQTTGSEDGCKNVKIIHFPGLQKHWCGFRES